MLIKLAFNCLPASGLYLKAIFERFKWNSVTQKMFLKKNHFPNFKALIDMMQSGSSGVHSYSTNNMNEVYWIKVMHKPTNYNSSWVCTGSYFTALTCIYSRTLCTERQFTTSYIRHKDFRLYPFVPNAQTTRIFFYFYYYRFFKVFFQKKFQIFYIFSKSLRLLLTVTEVTTEYQKWHKESTNTLFSCPKGKKCLCQRLTPSAGARSKLA